MSWLIGPGPIVHLSVPSSYSIGRAIEQVNPMAITDLCAETGTGLTRKVRTVVRRLEITLTPNPFRKTLDDLGLTQAQEADVLAGPLLAQEARKAGVVDRSLTAIGRRRLPNGRLGGATGFRVVAAGKGNKYLPAYHHVTPEGVSAITA